MHQTDTGIIKWQSLILNSVIIKTEWFLAPYLSVTTSYVVTTYGIYLEAPIISD